MAPLIKKNWNQLVINIQDIYKTRQLAVVQSNYK